MKAKETILWMQIMRSRTIKNERKSMKLPTKRECLDLLKEYRLPQNVIAHSKAVNALSVFLTEKLKKSGINVNADLIDRASLLHDLDKIITLGKKSHGLETEKILKRMGYPELGRTAKKHKFSFVKKLDSWEEKVINYGIKPSILGGNLKLPEATLRFSQEGKEKQNKISSNIVVVKIS